MEIALLTALYEELLKLFIHFGAATKLAFGGKYYHFYNFLSDMVDKTARIRNNQKLLAGKISDDDSQYLETFIQNEERLGIMMMNGDNYKDKFYGYYQSTAWVLIRGAWLFDYIHKVFWYVVNNRDMSLIHCA